MGERYSGFRVELERHDHEPTAHTEAVERLARSFEVAMEKQTHELLRVIEPLATESKANTRSRWQIQGGLAVLSLMVVAFGAILLVRALH